MQLGYLIFTGFTASQDPDLHRLQEPKPKSTRYKMLDHAKDLFWSCFSPPQMEINLRQRVAVQELPPIIWLTPRHSVATWYYCILRGQVAVKNENLSLTPHFVKY